MPDSENEIKNNDKSARVESTTSIPFPPFWHEMPNMWFLQVEAVFSAKRVTSDNQQYLLTVAALPVDIIATVSDIISKPPDTGKFASLKSEVIKRLSLSETERLEKLIGTSTMGDLIPSAFFRRLQQLAGSSTAVTEELLKTLWLKRLPEQLRSIILVQESQPMGKLTELADKIWEFQRPSTSSSICSASGATENSATSQITLESLAVSINELRQQIFKQGRSRQRDFPRNRSRNRSGSKARSSTSSVRRSFCYYHFRFGAAAKKCAGGSCTFTGQGYNNPTEKSENYSVPK